MIQIIGAPFDFGGKRLGSRLGPVAIRLAEIERALRSLGFETKDCNDVETTISSEAPDGFRYFETLLSCVEQLRHFATQALETGDMPLILGGEHTLAAGGISAALEREDHLGLLWIDAHGDVQTPGSSETGNIHGMPIAALQGLPSGVDGPRDVQWRRLLQSLGPKRLSPSQTAWYGLRDVDPGEKPRIQQGFAVTMHEIDRYGIEETVNRLDIFWRSSNTRRLWISFDVDVLDPILAPGTGTAVRGGLSYREAHLFAELLRERMDEPGCPYKLLGIDVVETNPLADTNNETAKMAVEWVASLLGKTIL